TSEWPDVGRCIGRTPNVLNSPVEPRPERERAVGDGAEMSGMRFGMDLSTRMDQKMILAPRMIQSMEILQLTIVDLQAKIEDELQKNPFLEQKEHLGEQNGSAEKEFNPDAPLKHDESGDLEFSRL